MAFYIIYHRFATVRVRRPIGFRTPPNQIPYAVQSDSVRRPIGFRSPSDQIPFAVQSDSVRRTTISRVQLRHAL